MPDQTSSAVKTGSVQVKYADGSEHTLPIHGITQMRFLAILDELEIKSFDEVNMKEPTLQVIRVIQRVAAEALTSQKDPWGVQRIQESFPDMVEVTKIFLACFNLSQLSPASKPVERSKKTGQYQ